eukprot:135102-Pyramimonas_sp.AAC.1
MKMRRVSKGEDDGSGGRLIGGGEGGRTSVRSVTALFGRRCRSVIRRFAAPGSALHIRHVKFRGSLRTLVTSICIRRRVGNAYYGVLSCISMRCAGLALMK